MFWLVVFAVLAMVGMLSRSRGDPGDGAELASAVAASAVEGATSLSGGSRHHAHKLGGGQAVDHKPVEGAKQAQRRAAKRGEAPDPDFDPVRIGDHRPEAPPSTLNRRQARTFSTKRAEELGLADAYKEVRDETLPPGAIVTKDGTVAFNYADSGRPCGAGGAGCVRL